MCVENKCSCCSGNNEEPMIGEYVCYCNHVTEKDIIEAIKKGADSVDKVIEATGAMKNSNCKVNNPKGVCCLPDITYVFEKHFRQ